MRRVASRQARWSALPRHFIGPRHAKARLLSNKTHYSATDLEARISIKPGKARALNYLCSMAVDTARGVISQVQADFADSRDSVYLPGLLAQLQQRFRATGLYVHDVIADTGYSSGLNYALLERQGITPWIPVFSRYKPTIERFTYHAEADYYSCPAGKKLPSRTTTRIGMGSCPNSTAPRPVIAGPVRSKLLVSRRRSGVRSCARPAMPITAAPWTASTADRGSECGNSARVRWNRFLGVYCSIMAYAE